MRFKFFAVVCVLLVAGCGGSKKKSASPTTTSVSTPTTTTTTTSAAATPKFATSKNCAQLMALGTKLAQTVQTTSGSAETRIRNLSKLFHEFADAAPADVRGDFQTLASAFDTYTHALLKAGLKPGKTPTAAQIAQIQSATKAFNSPKLRAAEQHLSAWAQKNCGGTVSTTTG